MLISKFIKKSINNLKQINFDEITEFYKYCKENKTFIVENKFNKDCILFKF